MMSETMNNKDVAVTAMNQLFGDKDPSAVDRWMTSDYRQHSMAPDGPEGTRAVVASFHDGVRYELIRAIADGDLVALQGLYHGFGPAPFVAFDLLRIEKGKLAEHWDALTPLVEVTDGPTQIDGPTEITDPSATEANRALVNRFAEHVLVGGEQTAAVEYLSGEGFVQHDPAAGDGVTAPNLVYSAVHMVVAEGDVVLLVSEGDAAGTAVALWDLFRLADGRIVEHWAVTAPIAAELPHTNGVF
jgi:predicted SnoaL-like aldol condensation-catalyzing enzyme